MSTLTQHRGVLLGTGAKGFAAAALYSGISSNPQTYNAPAGRAVGSLMYAIVNVNASPPGGSGAWQNAGATDASGNWTRLAPSPSGNSSSEWMHLYSRIADGTSNDNISIPKGTPSTLVDVYIFSVRGYTTLAGQNINNATPGASPALNAPQVTPSATGAAFFAHLVSGAAGPHTVGAPSAGAWVLVETRSITALTTDPFVALYTIPTVSGVFTPAGSVVSNGTGATMNATGTTVCVA